ASVGRIASGGGSPRGRETRHFECGREAIGGDARARFGSADRRAEHGAAGALSEDRVGAAGRQRCQSVRGDRRDAGGSGTARWTEDDSGPAWDRGGERGRGGAGGDTRGRGWDQLIECESRAEPWQG